MSEDPLERGLREAERTWGAFRVSQLEALRDAGEMLVEALRSGRKVLVAGNGGSAAEAQHFAAELVGRYRLEKRRSLPAIALTTDTSILTALGNDLGFGSVFSRQVEALGAPGDVLVLLSTSGNSPNVLAAAAEARARGLRVIGLTGGAACGLLGACDVAIRVPSESTPRIQEVHLGALHLWCELVDDAFAEEPGR